MPKNKSITIIDEDGELCIGEYQMHIEKTQPDAWAVVIYNLDTKKTVEVPYEIYFERFRNLLEIMEKEFQ